MKNLGILVLLFSFILGCQNPNPKPQQPNTKWTALDEPPLFPDCPMDNAKINMACFAKILRNRLDKIPLRKEFSYLKTSDTLYLTLQVDTMGHLSVLSYNYGSKRPVLPSIISEITNVISSLPQFQPAFKTNLETPVGVQWTLPVVISQ